MMITPLVSRMMPPPLKSLLNIFVNCGDFVSIFLASYLVEVPRIVHKDYIALLQKVTRYCSFPENCCTLAVKTVL